MGFFSFLKKQFIDVIEWTEEGAGILSYRFPMQDQEIQTGAQLTVRETQLALFVDQGTVADLFGPGRHRLKTQNLPILTNLKNWDKFFESPFKSDVYFFSTREQLDQKWGTSSTITMRDKDFGVIRLRAHGTYSYKIKNPKAFYKKVSATDQVFTTQNLDGQLKALITSNMASFLGQSSTPFLDMASNQIRFGDTLKQALAPTFDEYGLSLEKFFVQSVTLPEELQAHLDKLASMNMLGDLKRYTQFQAAESLSLAAQNEGGGVASAGVGMGAGLAMGQIMSQALGGGTNAEKGEDPMLVIQKLHEMMTKGVITQAEFDAKKADLLKKI